MSSPTPEAKITDGRLRHHCEFFERGDEWACSRCGQVWVSLVPRPHDNPRNGDWRKVRTGWLRRPLRRTSEARRDTPREAQ